jgi:hypothetical protein
MVVSSNRSFDLGIAAAFLLRWMFVVHGTITGQIDRRATCLNRRPRGAFNGSKPPEGLR